MKEFEVEFESYTSVLVWAHTPEEAIKKAEEEAAGKEALWTYVGIEEKDDQNNG